MLLAYFENLEFDPESRSYATSWRLIQVTVQYQQIYPRTSAASLLSLKTSQMKHRLQFCLILIAESVDFETLQAYDVADLLKQYFRELPECLLTNKLSETFINIFTRKWTHFKIKVFLLSYSVCS